MKLIKPTTFQESMLVSSTATETYSPWNASTTYSINDKVTYQGRVWTSVFAGSNLNKVPGTNIAYWVDAGPDNKHAMFDRKVQTATTATTSLTVVLTPGLIDSIALINLNADLATVTIRNGPGGAIIYEYTGGLSGATILDWSQYFFYDPLLKRTQLIFSDIPPYANPHVTLELTSSTTNISVGELIFGVISDIGSTQYDATAGITDYSIKETDAFGNTSFVERPYSKRMQVQLMLKNSSLNRVYRLLSDIRATPVVWIGSDDPQFEEPLVVYGFYKSFDMTISYPQHSLMSLEVEGLV